jgi:hypothetical protein
MDRANAEKIIMQNLEEAYHARSRKTLMFDAQIKELAYMIAKEISEDQLDDFESMSEHLRNGYNDIVSSARKILPDEADSLLLGPDFKISFSAYACEELAALGITIPYFDGFDEIMSEDDLRIAYFSNRSADEAYFEFLHRFPGASQLICDSIAAACEEVSYGRCELCMLPIYSSADGMMQNVYRQTVKYGLSMVMYIDMPADRDISVRFGLFAPSPCKTEKADTMMLTVVSEEGGEIAQLPCALMSYGAEFENINSLPPALHDGSRAWELTFSLKNADISKIHLFLQIYFPRFEISGICERFDPQKITRRSTEDQWTYGR